MVGQCESAWQTINHFTKARQHYFLKELQEDTGRRVGEPNCLNEACEQIQGSLPPQPPEPENPVCKAMNLNLHSSPERRRKTQAHLCLVPLAIFWSRTHLRARRRFQGPLGIPQNVQQGSPTGDSLKGKIRSRTFSREKVAANHKVSSL